MLSVLLILFFGITGLLLNHPDWTFGQQSTTTTATGTLPSDSISGDSVDFLVISDYVRGRDEVGGTITDHSLDGTTGTIVYAGPGMSANVSFDTSSGEYTATKNAAPLTAVLGDIHRGYATGAPFGVAIDATAIFLILVGLTGLAIEVLNRSRHRRRHLLAAVAGLVAGIAALVSTIP